MLTLLVVAAVVIVIGAVMGYGALGWQKQTTAFRAAMHSAQVPMADNAYDTREIEALPAPVQRYFRAVLRQGQAMVSSVRLTQQGQFLQNGAKAVWQPFHATQLNTTQPPGFDWDARIKMTSGLNVYVRDSYALGAGSLRAAIQGLVTVARMHGTPQMAQGELMRYLAEAVWYPTALLPSQGIRWDGIDDTSARATLTDGAVAVSLVFAFNLDGTMATAWASSRPRSADQSAPWLCRYRDYVERSGMLVPLEGEVEWQPQSGPQPYWRGRLTGIEFKFQGQ